MSNAVIGDPIQTYEIYVKRQSVAGFVINWFTDDLFTIPKNDVDGMTFQVLVGDRDAPVKTWTAIAVQNKTTFYLDETDSDLPFKYYDGLILYQGQTALANIKIIVEPE
jgi:hypothetical protein